MAELATPPRIEVERVRENLRDVRAEIAAAAARAGRGPISDRSAEVQVLAATKYVALEDMPTLARAGVELVGENRAQDLQAKVAAHGELFTWDFIGRLQSRKVRQVVPHVRLIHSVASESVLRELERHRELARPGLQVLIEVNIAREAGKEGVAPKRLDAFLERMPRGRGGADDDAPAGRRARGQPPLVRRAARARCRARAGAALDGDLPGLPRGHRRGRHHRADRH